MGKHEIKQSLSGWEGLGIAILQQAVKDYRSGETAGSKAAITNWLRKDGQFLTDYFGVNDLEGLLKGGRK